MLTLDISTRREEFLLPSERNETLEYPYDGLCMIMAQRTIKKVLRMLNDVWAGWNDMPLWLYSPVFTAFTLVTTYIGVKAASYVLMP